MISIPDPQSSIAVADWIELIVATKDQHVSKASIGHMLESTSGEEANEPFVCDIWNELISRQKLYDVSPYEIDNLAVEPNDEFSPKKEHQACLILSLFGVESGSKIPKLFEKLTCTAVKKYLSGEATVFGWPVRGGSQASIRKRVIEVAEKLNEKFVESPPERYKDRGVDVIGWKPFGEDRSSQVVILLQCAAGIKWRDKTGDLPMRAWEQYIHWACNPVKAFAVPCIVSERDWHDVSKEAGIVFDRVRILNLLQEVKVDEKLTRELEAWIKKELGKLN